MCEWGLKSTDVPRWNTHTGFRGCVVPLDIIEEMKRVNGDDDWHTRDVEVCSDAWQVLLDWYEGMLEAYY